ncbi:MAG: S9 family peptidase [Prevotella sp.]|nr:S9 family peptidase [Prevotella sp.]
MKTTLTATMLMLALSASAQVKTEIHEFNHAGPFAVGQPFEADTVNVGGKKFDVEAMLNAINADVTSTNRFAGDIIPSLEAQKSVGVLSFYLNNSSFLKGKVVVKGPKNYKLFVDGVGGGQDLKLAPEHHTIAIKYLAEPKDTDSISVYIEADAKVPVTLEKQHPYMVHDLTDGKRVRDVTLSADGAFAVVSYQTTSRGGESRWSYELLEVKNLQLKSRLAGGVRWMPRSCAYIEEANEGGKRTLYRVNPLTGERKCWATNLPKGGYAISPTEDYLIITAEEEGPKEDADVFEVVEMDDRQPGWRNRSYLLKYDLATGISQRIVLSPQNTFLEDISQDGKKLLIGISYSRLSERPTEVQDAYIVDAQTLKADTLFKCYGFIGGGSFSPDGKQILFTGTPEAFDRIGCQLPQKVTPSMTENELFLFDIATHKVTPLTKDFDPSVQKVEWSLADGQIYFSAEDRDYVNMFSIDQKTLNIKKLPVNGDYAYRWNMAARAPVVAYVSYKTLEPASAYLTNLKTFNAKKNTLVSQTIFDGKEALGDALLGTCQDWNFTNSKGDTVYGRLYLPNDFDESKKYPMIVYYYGGCSPVSRYFESPYAPQYWNSLGYVAYILQPSGATGFGQEWASRHVNTAGQGPAEDIIEGTKKICEAHPFIDKKKIGCMGASYGGFMTQYLQTQTDIFAAAVSHAGIANHTSYWGEGYWGYNYSEVSMANSYPWSHRQLYVDQSPLFNADKIHTPLLLLHGNADTNVPLIESLQMFTALKLLGREVSLVEVKGENHHILDYKKREKWLATQMAWFQRWLKDDPSWWNELYPKKHL